MYEGNIIEDAPPRESLSTVWKGRIARSAQAIDDYVEVIIPAFDELQRFGPARWLPRATNHTYTSPDTSWHDIGASGQPAFASGFRNYGTATGDLAYNDAGFRKLASGLVTLKGLIVSNSGSAGTAFTLPVGYRPAKRLIFGPYSVTGAVRVDVDPTGTVGLQSSGLGTNGWFSLEEVQFWVGPDLSLNFTPDIPLRGDDCVVTWDEQNRPYVLEWWPA